MPAMAHVHNPPPAGLRERKKQRTREALIDAAFTLFAEKGFDATTVEEIAAAVEVSSRTFFRYFPSKEEVVITLQRDQFDAVLAELQGRPPGEPVVTSIRHAIVTVIRAYEEGAGGFDATRFHCVQELMTASPTLNARSMEHFTAKQADLTRIIADRMGVDPVDDLRPHLVAAVTACGVRGAIDAWLDGVTPQPSAADAFDQAFTLLENGINYPAKGAPA